MTSKQRLVNTIDDLVSDFLYYDRKEDEELGVGVIEKMIADKEVTVDEIVDRFRARLLL